jgi:hypothetical protein
MQEIWENYMKPVDGRPSAVAFNAEAADALPNDTLGFVGFIKLRLRSATEEGFVAESEADMVKEIEDRLEMEALRYRVGKYIGRIVTGGEVHFIYYLKYDFEWPDVAAVTMAAFPDYTYEYGSRPDPEWEVYRKLLFPTDREWQLIQNHHTCDRLKAAGDNLRIRRAIEHRAFFAKHEGRERFVEHISAEGFKVQADDSPEEVSPPFGIRFYRMDAPYYYDIDAVTLQIIAWAEAFEGQYDGWETSLVKQ